jgi:hypothetical protein
MGNDPGSKVGAEVVPEYIGEEKKAVPSPSVQVATVVPLKQISNPPPFPGLKNRIKVGMMATGEPFRK